MSELALPLTTVRQADAQLVGAKAAALGTLLEAGFPVPPGICITTAAFHLAFIAYHQQIERVLARHDLRDLSGTEAAADEIATLLVELAVPDAMMTALREFLPAVAQENTPMAVRSSATVEDRAEASFAGQYVTHLGVRGEDAIRAAIIACWRSFFSAHALAERAAHNALGPMEAMAVLIQPMIEAECAGVCLSVDPVRQRRDLVVVEAAWGQGIGVVDGVMATDTARVRRFDSVLEETRIVHKPEQIVLDHADGVRRTEVPEERRRAACLPEMWVQQIAWFGIAAETLFRCPQDMEWAIADGRIWVLQSRPITALPPELAHVSDFPVVWRSDAERRGEWEIEETARTNVPVPLELDRIATQKLAWLDTVVFDGLDRSPETRELNGRPYYRSVPSPLSPGDRRIRRTTKQDLVARLYQAGLTEWDYWGPEIMTTNARLRAVDLASADGPQLAEHLEDVLGAYRRHWFLHPQGFNPPHDAFDAVSGLSGEAAAIAWLKLLDGEETPLTRLIDGVYELAMTAREIPEVMALVRKAAGVDSISLDLRAELQSIPAATKFSRQLETFLNVFGDRCGDGWGSEIDIRTPTWREQPRIVLHFVTPYLDPGVEAPATGRARARTEHDRQVAELVAACANPEAVAEFQYWLPVVRRSATVLEEHNFHIDQLATGLLRGTVVAAAHWLIEKGALDGVDDIVWLRSHEILEALREDVPSGRVALVAERKVQHAVWSAMEAPPILGVPAALLEERPPLQDDVTTDVPDTNDRLVGLGASPGRVRGRARVVSSTVLLPRLAPGDVLVAENAGPTWTPLFPILGGLVLDGGAMAQHAATTAREYGVPAVIGTHNATRRIPDGAWVVIDGSAGTIDVEL